MRKTLRGKYLVRKSMTNYGKPCLVVTGMFFPVDFDINDISDSDEMWVSDITINGDGIRFTDPKKGFGPSPEDFLSGDSSSPSSWKNQSKM